MKPDLPDRARMLFGKFNEFPEAGKHQGYFLMRPEAFAAFLDARQLWEREIAPALDELKKLQEEG